MFVSGLSYRKNQKAILSDLSFEVNPSGINWVLGPNGSGKSSLLGILGSMETKYRGNIPETMLPSSGEVLGLSSENGYGYNHLSVSDNLSLLIAHHKIHNRQVQSVLESWNLWSSRNHSLNALSKGQKSRFSMVVALLNDPHFLLLDEPESGLDFKGLQMFERSLVDWRSTAMVVIIASHNLGSIERDDHLIVLSKGRLSFKGSAKSLMSLAIPATNSYLTFLQNTLTREFR